MIAAVFDFDGTLVSVPVWTRIVRLQLREGQARRLSPSDLPRVDRPLHFAVVRGNRSALEGDSLDAVRARLDEAGEEERRSRMRGPRRRRR